MDENKVIDTEFTEVKGDTEKKKKVVDVDISPEDLIDLLPEVNDLVDGYSLIYRATKRIVSKLQKKGYPTEQILGTINVLCERVSSKASAKGLDDEEEDTNETQEKE